MYPPRRQISDTDKWLLPLALTSGPSPEAEVRDTGDGEIVHQSQCWVVWSHILSVG